MKKPTVQLSDLLAAAGKRMTAELRERLIHHPGELGADREEIVRRFLRSHLPKRFDVANGFVFDAVGRVSDQLDVIVADALSCPRFEMAGGVRMYPCESVVAVGQIKSRANSHNDLSDAFENLASVKALERSQVSERLAEADFADVDHLNQIFTFALITGEALTGATAQEALLDYVLENDVRIWPNVIFALDKYLLTYCCDDGVCANPTHARGVALEDEQNGDNLLMKFLVLLGHAVEAIQVNGMPYRLYLQKAATWSAKAFYSATDDPPPLLSTLSRR